MKKNECVDFFKDLKLDDDKQNLIQPSDYSNFIKDKIKKKDIKIRLEKYKLFSNLKLV